MTKFDSKVEYVLYDTCRENRAGVLGWRAATALEKNEWALRTKNIILSP